MTELCIRCNNYRLSVYILVIPNVPIRTGFICSGSLPYLSESRGYLAQQINIKYRFVLYNTWLNLQLSLVKRHVRILL